MKKIIDQLGLNKDCSLFVLLFSITLVTLLFLSVYRKFDRDEFEAVHSAWKLLNGELIYVDFFQHHHSFLYYLIGLLLSFFREGIVSLLMLRVVGFGCLVIILRISYQIYRITFRDYKTVWLALLLLVTMVIFSEKAFEIRPDVPQTIFGLFSILMLMRYGEYRKIKHLILSGMSLAISFLFLQKAIFICAAISAVQIFWLFKNEMQIKKILAYWFVFFVTISPYFAYLIVLDQIDVYWFYNWKINMSFKDNFSAFATLLTSFYYNHFVWIFFVIGIWFAVKKGFLNFLLLCILLLGVVFVVQAPYRQYFMPSLPFVCGLASLGIVKLLSGRRLIIIVVLMFLVPFIYFIRELIVYPNKQQLDKIEWVSNNTNSTDHVYDGNVMFNLFRKDIDFFWYSVDPNKGGLATYRKLKPYAYDIYLSIEKFKPKIVSSQFIDVNHPVVKNYYDKSDAYDDLYIRR